MAQRDDTGAEEPRPSALGVAAVGNSGVEPTTTQQLFDRIDCAAGDFQYVVIENDTYLFWIQPGKGTDDWERVNWYNLNDLTKHGQVTWSASRAASAKRNNTDRPYKEWFDHFERQVWRPRLSGRTQPPPGRLHGVGADAKAAGRLFAGGVLRRGVLSGQIYPKQLPHHAGGIPDGYNHAAIRLYDQHLCLFR